jgi:hypothetical protein
LLRWSQIKPRTAKEAKWNYQPKQKKAMQWRSSSLSYWYRRAKPAGDAPVAEAKTVEAVKVEVKAEAPKAAPVVAQTFRWQPSSST